MKRTVMGVVGFSVAAFAGLVVAQRFAQAAESTPAPTYIDSQRVLDNFDKKNANPLIPGDAYNVQTNRRTANENIEIHEKETDIFYIVDGSAVGSAPAGGDEPLGLSFGERPATARRASLAPQPERRRPV